MIASYLFARNLAGEARQLFPCLASDGEARLLVPCLAHGGGARGGLLDRDRHQTGENFIYQTG